MKLDLSISSAVGIMVCALNTKGVNAKGLRLRNDLLTAVRDQRLNQLVELVAVCTDAHLHDDACVEYTLRAAACAALARLKGHPPCDAAAWKAIQAGTNMEYYTRDEIEPYGLVSDEELKRPSRATEDVMTKLADADATSSGGWQFGDRLTDTPEPRANLRYPTTRYEDAYANVRKTVRRDVHRTLPPENSGTPSGAIDMLDTWNGHPEMLRKARGENFIKKHVEGNPHIGGHARDRVMKGIRNDEDGVWFDYDNILGVKQDGIFLKVQLDGLATMYQPIPSTTEPVADARYDRPAKEEPRFAPLDPQELRDIEYGSVHGGSRLLSCDDIVEYAPPAKPMHNASTLHSGAIVLGHSHNANAGETNGAPKPAEASTETIIEPAQPAKTPTSAAFNERPTGEVIGEKSFVKTTSNYFQTRD